MPAIEPRLPIAGLRHGPPSAGGLLPFAALGLLGLMMASIFTAQPAIALAVPAAGLGAIACALRPAAAVLTVFALTGTTNTIQTLTPIPNGMLADFLLLGLWLGIVATYLSGRAERSFWLWPALIAPLVYLALTAVGALLVEPVSFGLTAFKAAAWYLAAIVLVAIAPWSREVHRRMAQGIVAIALVVGLYCLFRFLTGPSVQETAAARAAQPGLPVSVQARFFGSWLSANQLAAWVGTVIPFLLVAALAWRGRWRLVAMAALALLAVALFESDVRTGIVAVAAGSAVVFALYLVSPAFPGRLAAGLAGLLAILAIGGGGYALTVGTDDTRADRFSGLLSPGDDKAFNDRLATWEGAFDAMGEEPWGYGLGAAGGVAETNQRASVVSAYLDSSYIKVGLEQGFLVMVLYVGALGLLLAALGLRATRTRDRQSAMLMIGACGSLAAVLPMFYAGLYSEGLPILAAWLIVGLGVSQVTIHDAGPSRAHPVTEW
jgi:hypothetical protein